MHRLVGLARHARGSTCSGVRLTGRSKGNLSSFPETECSGAPQSRGEPQGSSKAGQQQGRRARGSLRPCPIVLRRAHSQVSTHPGGTGRTDGAASASSPCSFGLSDTSQQYFSLTTNQPLSISQQYSSHRTNQHQPSATSQPNRLH
jgi:hypothetical protein